MGLGVGKNKNDQTRSSNGLLDRFIMFFGGDRQQALRYLILLIVSAVVALILFFSILWANNRETRLAESLGDVRLLSQQIAKQATEAASRGDEKTLSALTQNQQKFKDALQTIKSKASQDKADQLETDVQAIDDSVNKILSNQALIKNLQATGVQVTEAIPGIQTEYNLLADEMTRAGYPASQVALAKNQVYLSERILRSLNALLTGADYSLEGAENFNADAETFNKYLNAQLSGSMELGVVAVAQPQLRKTLESIKAEYEAIIKSTNGNLKDPSKMIEVRKAATDISAKSDAILATTEDFSGKSYVAIAILSFLFLLAVAILAYALYQLLKLRNNADSQRVVNLQQEYDRNQNAILRLLDEIADLAEGDLRSHATVSEDFTGAIADSINFAIDQIRDLVSRINATSEEISKYSQETQNITMQLSEASEHNAQEIASASNAIMQMATSIDNVSMNASESADVAKRSVGIAANGANVVNRTIQGMDTIREQIQETSKRIKRLGESSQEIGNIVSLINDIADQTNILALNAAIQASMAGEAGRGFAVVADEVQRLAERSTAATKQIESLVKTIQADTNEAVSSMELTTTEVVRGTTLAKDAGVALDEIQSVSGTLANLIENISDSAREQASSATHIAQTMNVVQDITHQTTSSTMEAARSVTELAQMAEALRESVTDFKLPENA
ncbi:MULTISPECIES: methyl-accepting chemotaxis protein [unclassified Acinetobacter]|uniref:methyl-accepting chemotaxis protein n=1 Tax=unclassified Acinetobacter TaxID=196816 RepID=UPI0035B7A114